MEVKGDQELKVNYPFNKHDSLFEICKQKSFNNFPLSPLFKILFVSIYCKQYQPFTLMHSV